mgnify:CR=1 FL=1
MPQKPTHRRHLAPALLAALLCIVTGCANAPEAALAELRAIAGVGQDASPQIPRAEAKAMSLDKLPYNWMSIGGRMKPGLLSQLARPRRNWSRPKAAMPAS